MARGKHKPDSRQLRIDFEAQAEAARPILFPVTGRRERRKRAERARAMAELAAYWRGRN